MKYAIAFTFMAVVNGLLLLPHPIGVILLGTAAGGWGVWLIAELCCWVDEHGGWPIVGKALFVILCAATLVFVGVRIGQVMS